MLTMSQPLANVICTETTGDGGTGDIEARPRTSESAPLPATVVSMLRAAEPVVVVRLPTRMVSVPALPWMEVAETVTLMADIGTGVTLNDDVVVTITGANRSTSTCKGGARDRVGLEGHRVGAEATLEQTLRDGAADFVSVDCLTPAPTEGLRLHHQGLLSGCVAPAVDGVDTGASIKQGVGRTRKYLGATTRKGNINRVVAKWVVNRTTGL